MTGTGFDAMANPTFRTTSLLPGFWVTTRDSDTQLTAVQSSGTPVAGGEEGWVELMDGAQVSNHLPFTWT